MAIEGNKAGSFNGQYPQYATPYIFWSYEQSIPYNQTVLTATLKVKREKTGSTTTKASTPWSIDIGGTKTSGTISFKITSVSAGEFITIGSTSKTIPHNDNGSISAISISASIDISGTTLGKGTVSTSVTPNTIPRYGTCTQVFGSKNETAIGMGWSSDSVVDYVWYSIDNGSTWTAVGSANYTSGSYTIYGLSPNTSYNIKTRIRRKDSQLTTDSSSLSVITYAYPYLTTVEVPSLFIGNTQKIILYNPLSRTVIIKMYKDSIKGVELYSGTTSSTSITFTPTESTLYDSIADNSSAKCVYHLVYGNYTHTTTWNYTYKIKGTEKPVFNNFIYKDTNSTISEVLGSDQYLVKGLSNLQVTIPSASKMVAQNYAEPKNYIATLDTLNNNADYSTNDVYINLGTPINAGTKRLTVTAYDYRNLYSSAYKDVIIFEHNKPVVNVDIKRLNNFEAETTLKVSGTYSRIIIDGTDKNTIIGATYRYRETGGDWSSETNLKCTISNGEFTCNDVVLSLDNAKEFEFEISIKDKLQTVNRDTYSVGVGQAVFFISSNKKQCYINGKLVKGSLEISAEEPTNGEELWIQKGKNILNYKNVLPTANTSITLIEDGFCVKGSYAGEIVLNVKPNTDYYLQYISTNITGNTKLVTVFSGISQTTILKSFGNYNGGSFNSGTNTMINIWFYAGTGTNSEVNFTKIQLAESLTATEYEEYKEKNIYLKNNNTYDIFLDVEKLNNQQDYSLVEKIIGTWIDGKPIYRKVTNLSTNWVTGVNTFNTGITNMDTLINSQIYFRYNSTYNIWYSNYDQYQNKRYLNGGSNYELTLGNGLTVEEAYLITEYTKT